MRRELERAVVAATRRLERPAERLLARPGVRARLGRRARRAWRATHAPLIVCYGNINRSAFAGALVAAHGRPGVRSGGFYPVDGRSAPEATIACAARYGVDLAGHRSRRVTRADLDQASAIFVFDLENIARLALVHPGALARTHLLGSLDGDPGVLIRDPHGRGQAVLEEAMARIAEAVEGAEAAG